MQELIKSFTFVYVMTIHKKYATVTKEVAEFVKKKFLNK